MNIGDEVIINPLVDGIVEPGIFIISNYVGDDLYCLTNGNIYHGKDLIPADPLEVGDKVVIRTNLESIKNFPHGLVQPMLSYEGMIVTISEKCDSNPNIIGEGKYYYRIKEDNLYYSWPLCAFSNAETIIKQSKNDENRLQKQETSVDRRSTELRFGVRRREHRARIEVSSLKHKKVVGRG